MPIIRREFLQLSGLAVAAPSIANIAVAQAQIGPKLTQILRNDLEGQGQIVQETVVSIVEPSAQRERERPQQSTDCS
jgi:hypothetical protein